MYDARDSVLSFIMMFDDETPSMINIIFIHRDVISFFGYYRFMKVFHHHANIRYKHLSFLASNTSHRKEKTYGPGFTVNFLRLLPPTIEDAFPDSKEMLASNL